jgi:hypothetical protein
MNPYLNPDQEKKLEELIHRELHRWPELQAPATLIPRVMAAIQVRAQRPWWQRSFPEWPGLIQGVFLIVLSASAGFLTWESATLWAYLSGHGLVQDAVQGLTFLDTCCSALGALMSALHTINRIIISSPVVWAGLTVLGCMYGSCIGLGTLGYQLASKNQIQQRL